MQRYLSPSSRRGRPRPPSLRTILDAIFYALRTGCAWRYLPSNFPPWPTVFYHCRRFRLNGAWHLLYSALHRAERKRVGRDPDPSAAIMDSQSVKTAEESGRIRGYDARTCVKGRKRHLPVDTLGLPIACYVTPADAHDTGFGWVVGVLRDVQSRGWPYFGTSVPGARSTTIEADSV